MLSAVCSLLLVLPAAAPSVEADYLIRGALICDGTDHPGRKGDVAIKGDRIVAVGTFPVQGKPVVLDAAGLIVAPGFIDLHTHSDDDLLRPATRANLNYLTQGVTTVVTGNCGFGPVDVGGYYQKLDAGRIGSNVVHLIPHNTVRQQVMGNVNRPPTAKELERMKALVDRGMRDGAWGMSTGLIYNPGTYADTTEIIELAKVVAQHGGIYATHMRNEGTGLLPAIHETLEIGRQAGLPVHISHMKASGRRVWGKAADAVALVADARAKGQAVTADQYPYTATVIPAAYREGSNKDLLARLDDPQHGPKMRAAIAQLIDEKDGGRAIRIASYSQRPDWQGQDLLTIAQQEKMTVLDLVIAIQRSGGAGIVNFGMSEEDVRVIMKQPFVATASDGSARVPGDSVPHPRSYGCFPRKIGRYALEEKLISLEHAIRSASGLPADILRLPERGYLKPGYFADVVVFDPQTFRDQATYDRPHQYSTGVRWLFVNGVPVIHEGRYTGALPGKVLRHESKAQR
jgi:N-acyl-D-aspartate/D-glutamate deacylase